METDCFPVNLKLIFLYYLKNSNGWKWFICCLQRLTSENAAFVWYTKITLSNSCSPSFVPSNQKRIPYKSFPPIRTSACSQAAELPRCLQEHGHASFGVCILFLFLSACRCHDNWPLHCRCHRNCFSSIQFVQDMEMTRDMKSRSISELLSSSCAKIPLVFYRVEFSIMEIFFNKIRIFHFLCWGMLWQYINCEGCLV